ncbi:uncharacterized protein LOC122665562 [Telopea speciosissima]|uniref:uncharacterized protein LOC122665562 n=1 Tax=Telopea speciosissima TaxID=54955 RepID=UPI001CC37FC8|nr:uncharacterized protein LOC122665562 [Telopea speciosissima]
MRFSKKGKLSPRYIGPYEILAKIGSVAYWLVLPPSLDGVPDVFHVSMLRKYVHDPSHVLSQEPPELAADMSYKEQPEKILHSKVVNLRDGYFAGLDVQSAEYDGIGIEEPEYVSKEHGYGYPCDDYAYGH